MKATFKIPFDLKDNLKKVAKENGGILLWEPISKTWEFSGSSIPEELKPYLIKGSLIEPSNESNKNWNEVSDLDFPDFFDENPKKETTKKETKAKQQAVSSQNELYTYAIDFPFEKREEASKFSLTWHPLYKCYLIRTSQISDDLKPYLSHPFSYEAWIEFFLNKKHRPQWGDIFLAKDEWEIRDYQTAVAKAVGLALNERYTGFLIADEVGLGKTVSAIASTREISEKTNAKTVLVVTTLSACAHWRNSFLKFNIGDLKILIINYDKLPKLFKPQEENFKKPTKRKRTKNKRLVSQGLPPLFDVAIFDESHKMRKQETMRSKLGKKIAKHAKFSLYLSATAGQNPLELSYLIPLLSKVTGDSPQSMEDFEKWCQKQDLGITRGPYGKWLWDGSEKSIEKIQSLLFKNKPPVAIRRLPSDIAGWPEINRELIPFDLQPEQIQDYKTSWEEFKRIKKEKALLLKGISSANNKSDSSAKKTKPFNHLVENLRFRQKASLLKIDSTIDYILDGLDNNHQVAVSVAFKETMFEIYNKLKKQGIESALIFGEQNPNEKEQNRLDFQKGARKVVLFTVEEAISLHQGEHNDVPRIMLIHDLRWSAISMAQIEGRTHRDGKFSQIYWLFLNNTIEQEIAQIVLRRLINMKGMVGDDTSTLKEIEEVFLKYIE